MIRLPGARLRVLAAGASVALSGCWLQPGFDAGHTRWNPVENQITTANVADLAEVWSVDVEAPELFEPLVSGGRVFVGWRPSESRGGGVLALDAATGETAWDRTTTPAGPYVDVYPETLVEGEVWSSWWRPSPDGCEFATVRLDRDGTLVDTDRSAFVRSSTIQSGRYLVQRLSTRCPTATDWPPMHLTVRDSRTLETLWTADVETWSAADNFGPISGGQIFTSEFLSLAGCGAPTCSSEVHPEGPVSVARPEGDVFGVKPGFGGPNAEVVALSRTTGRVVWRTPLGSSSATLAADDAHLYVAKGNATTSGGPGSGRLLAFDSDGCGSPTCAPLWSASVDPEGGRAWDPVVAGGVVYVARGDNTIRAYAADGCGRPVCEEIGRVAVDGRIDTMVVAEGHLLVTSEVTPGSVHRVTAYAP